ncbi:outer membrane protein transport protein [Campylobacter sp. 2018MI10]|uniref:OmpP1/FadL family transporter n=1 Tax=Campylobacter sp. 2018MI10 TaxID=2836736 RepID=UPI001BD9D9C8|nr:outer membrane protein transport protein [Campylobacter sp. 2018MI10]MBT0884306.1 outer membrane protein transport protein [Campylobacter sp. 2018MI10]
MNKVFLSFVVSGSLLASNYKLVPLSADGVALSSSNLAKSFSADAAFINPANMGFLGQNPQLHFSSNFYNAAGSRFTNELVNGLDGEPYYNATDAHGKEFSFFIPTLAFVYPINEQHFVGFAGYTDFAAVYGWNSDYAKALANNMDIRGGTAAISYAYKPIDELSLGASLTLNHTRIKFNILKDNAKNPRYIPTDISSVNRVWVDEKGNAHPYSWVYEGDARVDNGYKFGYKLSLTYVPKYFDDKLRFSLLYNSSYKNKFEGNIDFKMSKFGMFDFANNLSPKNQEQFNSMQMSIQELAAMSIGLAGLMSEVYKIDPNTGSIVGTLPTQDSKVGYNGYVSANFLYPANANFGIAYEYGKHEFMFNMGRTFWSKAKTLDLKINSPEIPQSLKLATMQFMQKCAVPGNDCNTIEGFQKVAMSIGATLDPKDKQAIEEYFLSSFLQSSLEQGWRDTTLLSFGYRYNYDKELSLMLGFSTEDSPVRREKISFLAKDSRMYMYSLGLEYRLNKNLKVTGAGAYQHYADVKVNNVTDNILIQTKGKFSNQSNQIVNVGINYEF